MLGFTGALAYLAPIASRMEGWCDPPLPAPREPPALALPPPAPVAVALVPVDPETLPDAPGVPGSKWRDDKGRVRRVPSVPASRRALDVAEMAALFAEWMRDHELTGWFVAEDVAEFAGMFCAELALEEPHFRDLAGHLAETDGVTRDRKRIDLGSAWEGLRTYLLRTGRTPNRHALYRFDSHEEMAAAAAAEAEIEAAPKPVPKRVRKGAREAQGELAFAA